MKYIFIFLATILFAQKLDFSLIKKGKLDNNTLLIVGGIQGDEPGGFIAASLIATHYKITKGSVWVIPNLNFYSIIKRNRGEFGDLNRKFAYISKDDPDFYTISRIKKYIKDKHISMVINLHDGSGFFRYKYIDKNHNPLRWGNSVIIDQKKLPNTKYKDIDNIAKNICNDINKFLLKEEHRFRIKNTHTRLRRTFEEKEMAKTLTFFAIKNNKAALGHESSKSLPTHIRVYYKLLGLESLMKQMGIEFTRKFKLDIKTLKHVIDNDIYISFYNNKIILPLGKIKNILKYFPVDKDLEKNFKPSNPLMTILKEKKHNYYVIYYGNRRLSKIKPAFIPFANVDRNIKFKFNIDNKDILSPIGNILKVKKYFYVYPTKDFRINVIGYVNKKLNTKYGSNEVGVKIFKKDILKRFSIDKKNSIYRVEIYKKNKFVGMILVKFIDK